jgi:anti-sigma-K factor RskA
VTHDEIQSLLGAYALDAVEPEELSAVEEHIADCPRCQAEVAAHREIAGLLGNVGGSAPEGVWERLAADLEFERPPSRKAPSAHEVLPFRRKRQPGLPMIAALVAAAAVVIGLLGVSTIRLQHRVDNLRNAVSAGGLGQAAATAVLDPDHTLVRLASADGRINADVVVQPGGDAYLVGGNLPPIDSGHTYQLWGLANGQVVSLGLLGSDPRLAAFRVEPGVSRLMVTAEPRGGRPAPDTPVLIQGERPA